MSIFASELGRFVNITTGKLDANAAVEDGQFPFFTCSRSALQIDNYAFDTDAVLVAGNGDLNVKHYNGKFNAYQRTYVITINDHLKLNSRYLYYFMDKYVERLREQSIGGVIKYIKLGMLTEAKIPLPPLTEQKRIAAILDKADTIRRKRQQAIQLADDFLRAVFLDMFGDPVTNPKGWEVKPLSKGIDLITSGWSAKGESYPCQNGETGVLKISSVTSGKFKTEENKLVYEESIPEGKVLVFPDKGDLLFSRANTRELVAATCIVPNDVNNVFLPDKLWKITTKTTALLPEFLNHLIWQPRFKEKLTSQATGTSGSMLNISKSKFESTETIFPPLHLQKEFNSIYWKVQTTICCLEKSLLKVEEAFNSLSQNAFKGLL